MFRPPCQWTQTPAHCSAQFLSTGGPYSCTATQMINCFFIRRTPSTKLTQFQFVCFFSAPSPLCSVCDANTRPRTRCHPILRQDAGLALLVNSLCLKCLFWRHRSACRSLFMLVIGRLALPLFPRRRADVTQLITTALKGREREHDKEPSGRRDELLLIPERSSVLFSFSFWLSFLFIFENVPSHLQAAGASRHKGAIN